MIWAHCEETAVANPREFLSLEQEEIVLQGFPALSTWMDCLSGREYHPLQLIPELNSIPIS